MTPKGQQPDCRFDPIGRGQPAASPRAAGSRRCALAAITLLGGALLSLSAAARSDDSADERFLAGLRDRGLYELAETYCSKRLARDDLTARRRAELTAEYARTLAQWAVASPRDRRDDLFRRATGVIEDYLHRQPDGPLSLLIRYQAALNHLARGELLRREAEIAGRADARFEPARGELREAGRLLSDLAESAERLRREVATGAPPRSTLAPRDEVGQPSLTERELIALQRNIEAELARTRTNQALSYPAGSPDRAHALNEAIGLLGPLARLPEHHPRCWPSRLGLARAYRLLGDAATARRTLDAVEQAEPPAGVGLEVRAERLRLALSVAGPRGADDGAASASIDDASIDRILREGRELRGRTSAQLDLAWLETFLTCWRRAAADNNRQSAAHWREQATAMQQTIDQTYGPYWQHRAALLLAEQVRDVPDAADADVQLLIDAADDLYRAGRIEDALAGYDRAAHAAAERGDAGTAFAAAYRAAAIAHRRDDHAEAGRRFRQVSVGQPENPRAEAAHRLAIHHAGELIRAGSATGTSAAMTSSLLADYAELLREHLRLWPESAEADALRLRLGRIELECGRPAEALAVLGRIAADSSIAKQARGEMRRSVAGLQKSGRLADALAADAASPEMLARLAEAYPDEGDVQEAYALALASGGASNQAPAEVLRRALEQYRAVEARSPEGSDRWFRAKYAVAELHFRLGRPDRAGKIIRLVKIVHPELGGPAMREQFERLLGRCERSGERAGTDPR